MLSLEFPRYGTRCSLGTTGPDKVVAQQTSPTTPKDETPTHRLLFTGRPPDDDKPHVMAELG